MEAGIIREGQKGKAKVLILNDRDFGSGFGGQASFIRNLHPALSRKYLLVYLSLPHAFFSQKLIPIRAVYIIRVLFFLVRHRKYYDLAISHTPEASYVLSLFSLPYVHIFHGNTNPLQMSTFWYGKYFRPVFAHFEKRITKTAHKLFTVGEARLPAAKLYNPIVASDHTPIPFTARSGFTFAGRLEAVKNVDAIIRNYAMLPPEIKMIHNLNIVGTGSMENSLKKLVQELGQGDFVKFHGQVDSEVVLSIIERSIILLMSSSHEGFPMAIAESLSYGTPVISTDVGDISSVVKNGYNGFLLPDGYTYSDFYERVSSIIDDFGNFSSNSLKSSSIFNAEENSKLLISACDEIIGLPGAETK